MTRTVSTHADTWRPTADNMPKTCWNRLVHMWPVHPVLILLGTLSGPVLMGYENAGGHVNFLVLLIACYIVFPIPALYTAFTLLLLSFFPALKAGEIERWAKHGYYREGMPPPAHLGYDVRRLRMLTHENCVKALRDTQLNR